MPNFDACIYTLLVHGIRRVKEIQGRRKVSNIGGAHSKQCDRNVKGIASYFSNYCGGTCPCAPLVPMALRMRVLTQVILYQERGLTPSGAYRPAGEPTYSHENCSFKKLWIINDGRRIFDSPASREAPDGVRPLSW